jgi:hypothetical protein
MHLLLLLLLLLWVRHVVDIGGHIFIGGPMLITRKKLVLDYA